MMYKCTNNRSLLITDSLCLESELPSNWVPYAVLFTANSSDEIQTKYIEQLIVRLLEMGTKTFVCFGGGAEELHDYIDEIIFQLEEDPRVEVPENIVTTFHPDESAVDTVNYFIYGTDVPNINNGGLIALVGPEDKELRGALESESI